MAVHELFCRAMNYEWGKKGASSLVYQLMKHAETNLDPTLPYAELWMGDHPSAPSRTKSGLRIPEINGCAHIPYLFKALSVERPLSIQAHPDKKLAVALHAKDPTNYPDANHKPEMGIFLSRGSLLYGFRPFWQIVEFLNRIPEFEAMIKVQTKMELIANPGPASFKKLLAEVLHFPKKEIPALCESFLANGKKYKETLGHATRVAVRQIAHYFPEDVGLFFPLLLNVVCAEPGQAVFIPAGTLHAYLSGDLVEAMAMSDNVVRAAMTPKFVDIETLLNMLVFEPMEPKWVKGVSFAPGVTRYVPPCPEFLIDLVRLGKDQEVELKFVQDGISLISEGAITIQGQVKPKGTVLLHPTGSKLVAGGVADHSLVVCCTHLK